jgi:hypothetical protein
MNGQDFIFRIYKFGTLLPFPEYSVLSASILLCSLGLTLASAKSLSSSLSRISPQSLVSWSGRTLWFLALFISLRSVASCCSRIFSSSLSRLTSLSSLFCRRLRLVVAHLDPPVFECSSTSMLLILLIMHTWLCYGALSDRGMKKWFSCTWCSRSAAASPEALASKSSPTSLLSLLHLSI